MPDGRNTQSLNNRNGETAKSPHFPEWYLQRSLRIADLLISIDKGKSSEVAKQLIVDNKNIILLTGRVNVVANMMASTYFSDSKMLRDTIERIKSVPFVSRVEFTEVVEIYGRRDERQIEQDASRLLKSSGRNW